MNGKKLRMTALSNPFCYHMIDEEFCISLEYAMTSAFAGSAEPAWIQCFCDGIVCPGEKAGTWPGSVLQSKYLVTGAWIDEGRIKGEESSQFLYETKLYFGERSIENLKAGHRLESCIPEGAADSWIHLDRMRKILEIHLL